MDEPLQAPAPDLKLNILPIEIQKVPKQPHRNAGKVDTASTENKGSPKVDESVETINQDSKLTTENVPTNQKI